MEVALDETFHLRYPPAPVSCRDIHGGRRKQIMSAWTEFICEVIGVNNPIFFDIMSFSGLGETPGSIPWVKTRQISS